MLRWILVASLVTLTSSHAPAQTSDDAFQDFLDALEQSRQLILEQTDEDGTDRAEGLRHLVRLIEMQNARATDDHDPAHPYIIRCPTISCRVGFDNPDFTYISIPNISAEYTYRVFGKRGTVPYLSLQVFDNPFGGEVFMTSEELVVEEDGSYEIILSATEPEGAANWMELKPTADFFIMRNGFYDWDNEREASVQVEVIAGPTSGPVPVLTPDEFVEDMGQLAQRLRTIPFSIFSARETWPLNDVNDPSPEAFGIPGAGVPSAVSSAGRYELDTDEALIIETPEPDVIHGGVQIGNYWVESIDYASRQTSLNWFQSTPDSDGIIRYVLAHEDPGVPNWLDIGGHARGGIFFRWQSAEGDDYPDKPVVKLVAFDDIRANLPDDHPTVSASERAETLARRYLAVNKRRNPPGQFDALQSVVDEGDGGTGSGCSVASTSQPVSLIVLLGLLGLVRRWRRRRWVGGRWLL
jgi:MYXO-CTERM domain-containing protein